MTANGHVRIAGSSTVDDWHACKATLVVGWDPALWQRAHDNFFMKRLTTRYFAPIKALQERGPSEGEGFAIVALQCSLIEFLGATIEGKIYRFEKKVELGEFEYRDSKDMFVRFLKTYEPFNTVFDDALARDFYEGVRCGLLHEARTKKGWRIKTREGTGPFLDAKARIVYRDDLQRALETFAAWYRTALPREKMLQQAFLRKFDDLCKD
jgi:hypothetical protein